MTVIRQGGESYMHETVDKKVEIWKKKLWQGVHKSSYDSWLGAIKE